MNGARQQAAQRKFEINLEAQWTAVALLFGKPPIEWIWRNWNSFTVPLAFRMALEKVFEPEEVKRVGALGRMAYDYAVWYHTEPDGHGGYALTRDVMEGGLR